jgi:CheY-like chemotaxis protein
MPLPPTILCIDDDSDTLKVRKVVLEAYGFIVLTALSGADGMRLLSEGEPVDLVLLDYAMPGANGDLVAEQLKRLYPGLSIVIVSGFPDVPERLLKLVDGHVRKGQDAEALLEIISTVLEGGRNDSRPF